MAHDRDDGRAGDEGGLGFFHDRHWFRLLHRFLLGLDSTSFFPFFTGEGVAVQVTDGTDGVSVQRRVRVGEDAHAHQVLDDLERLGLKQSGQFGNGNGRLEVDDLIPGRRFLFLRRGCGGRSWLDGFGSRFGGNGSRRFFLGAGKQVESFFLGRSRTGGGRRGRNGFGLRCAFLFGRSADQIQHFFFGFVLFLFVRHLILNWLDIERRAQWFIGK